MKIIMCENYEEISQKAAELVAAQITEKPNSVLGLATGSSPVGMYKLLAESDLDFSETVTFNLDEYYPISADNPQSYHYFMRQNLFKKINIRPENIHIPNGEADNPELECANYEKSIAKSGGIDLQILGIGKNGHIGFNEPDDRLNCATHVMSLTESTIEANSRFFENIDDVPKRALTMGIATIMKAKKIVLLASGKDKYNAISRLLDGGIDTDIPASMLNVHPNVVLICDRAALGKEEIRLGVDIGGTSVKFAVVNGSEILCKYNIPTDISSESALVKCVADECKKLREKYDYKKIGVGTPGAISNGLVTADNLPLDKTPLYALLSGAIGMKVKVENDANCAGLGELHCGAGKSCGNMLMITLGTGVGGCVIIDRELRRGRGNMGEVGHMVIMAKGGRKCPCGQSGCLEQYASVTALIASAKEAAEKNKGSILADMVEKYGASFNGEIFFTALESGCPVAESVMNEYTDMLAVGIDSLINVLDPDMIVLSGGITARGDMFIDSLRKKIHFDTPIIISELQNDAGVLGAAML